MNPKACFALVLILACFIGWAVAGPKDDAEVNDAVEYCQKVHDHRWPDFHHAYKDECLKDGTVNMKYIYGN